MSDFQPQPLITRLFRLVRQPLNLGMQEYFAALDALAGGYGTQTPDELKTILQLIWCHSQEEQRQFSRYWHQTLPSPQHPLHPDRSSTQNSALNPQPSKLNPDPSRVQDSERKTQNLELNPQPSNDFRPLPLIPPPSLPDLPPKNTPQFYFPVSRRSMTYYWRYLRRPVADGPADLLDIPATVTQAAHQGFFLAPVYRRREVNRAHLLLLIDQEGSMMPLHRFTRELAETAQHDSQLEQVTIYYFHNLPSPILYQTPHLTQPLPLDQCLAPCDSDTSVLIVSDAGAARGNRRQERFQATQDFLNQVKQRTTLISWLNPMPKERWIGTSAEVIAYWVAMQPMDDDGFSGAIDCLRGQPLSHLYSPG